MRTNFLVGALNRLQTLTLAIALAWPTLGCAGAMGSATAPAHANLFEDQEALFKALSALDAEIALEVVPPTSTEESKKESPQSKDPKGESPQRLSIPHMKARYCLRRAADSYRWAKIYSGIDVWMLVGAGAVGGTGLALQTASALVSDNSTRKDLAIAGAVTIVSASALLSLRAALGLFDLAKVKRVAAANDVDAAMGIIEKHALAEDPSKVNGDGFSTCRDEDINVANAFPGEKNGKILQDGLKKAQEDLDKATEEAKEAKAELVSAKKDAEDRDRQSKESAASSPLDIEIVNEAKQNKAKKQRAAELSEAKADVAEKKVELFRAAAHYRASIFYLTKTEARLAANILKEAKTALNTSRTKYEELKQKDLKTD